MVKIVKICVFLFLIMTVISGWHIVCFAIEGAPLWLTNGVTICALSGDQTAPKITDGKIDNVVDYTYTGSSIIAWQDKRNGGADIYAQRIDQAGAARWGNNGVAICTVSGDQMYPKMTTDGIGGAIITWSDQRDGQYIYSMFVQQVNSSGEVKWTADGVRLCNQTAADSLLFSIAPVEQGNGGAVIAWMDNRNGGYDIYAQLIDKNGVPQWAANGVRVSSATGDKSNPKILSDGYGYFTIVWQDYRNGIDADLYAQKLNSSGNIVWTGSPNGLAIATGTGNQYVAELTKAEDPSHAAIITWMDERSGTPHIYAQKVDLNGAIKWTANGVAVCTATGNQGDPKIVEDENHGAIIVWGDTRNGNSDIYAQHIADADGSALWTANGIVICNATGDQIRPNLSRDGSGGALISWHDQRDGANQAVYTQRVDANGAVKWASNGVAVSTAPGSKGFDTAITSNNTLEAFVAWDGGRNIYAQRIGSARVNNVTKGVWHPTIREAFNYADTANLLTMEAGLFKERNMLWPNKNHITLRGAGSNETIISAEALGRVISVESGVNLTIEALTISSGSINQYGGGIWLYPGSILKLKNAKIAYCSAYNGGAIYSQGAKVIADGCFFIGNSMINSSTYGVVACGGTWEAKNCSFIDNSADYTGCGGGVFSGLSLVATGCAFSNNSAEYMGGVFHNMTGTLELNGCIFQNNSCENPSSMGGVAVGCNGNAYNCIFNGNSAYMGGFSQSGTWNLINCTLYNNSSSGPVDFGVMNGGTFNAKNTIIWGNRVPFFANGVTSLKYCDFQDMVAAGPGNKSVNPFYVNASGGNFHLLSTSECVNSGTFEGSPATDIDGNPRPNPANPPNNYRYFDMGCYEQAGTMSSSLIYVATTGSNTNGVGTIDLPYQTIGFALTKVATAGVVQAAAGIYRERNISWPKRNNIILRGAGANTTIITAEALGRVIGVEEAVQLTIEALTIMDGKTQTADSYGAGIYLQPGSILCLNSVIFKGNYACENSSDGGAVGSELCKVAADKCIFDSNRAWGYAGVAYMGTWEATNCIFVNNHAWAGGVAGRGLDGNLSWKATNCVFYGNYGEVYDVDIIIGGVFKAKNCIFWGHSTLFYSGEPTLATIEYSDVQGGWPGTGNINAMPYFISTSEGNFRLLATSECVNSGTFEGAPNHDLNNNPRPLPANTENKYYDMGCYEQEGMVTERVHNQTKNIWYPTIQTALNDADAGNIITLEAGIFLEHNITWPAYSNITIRGAGSNETIISGDSLGRVISVEAAVNLTIEALTIKSGKVTDNSGGGIYLPPNAVLYLRSVNIKENSATSSSYLYGYGAAIYCGGAKVIASDSTFSDNTANPYGGTVSDGNGTGSWEAVDCSFINNYAKGNGGCFSLLNLKATRCTFTGNQSDNYGGVLNNLIGTSEVRDCYFKNNISNNGGGVSYGGPSIIATNCIFDGNIAMQGAVAYGDDWTVANSVLVNNFGNSIICGSNFDAVNSIVWDNGGSMGPILFAGGATYSFKYSDVQDSVPTGEGNISVNPLFVASPSDLHLLANSECVNSGTFEGAPLTDLDGNPRPLPVNAENKYFDMGCYEQAGLFGPTITVIQPNGGDVITAESYYPVKWNISGNVTTDAYVRLSTNGGLAWSLITREAGILGISTYNWTVSNTPSTQCLISVEAGNPGGWSNDKSNGYFEIIPPPSAPTLEVIINGRRFVDGDVLPPNKSNMVSIKALGSGVVNMEMWLDGISVPLSALGGIPPVWVGTFIVTPDSSPAHILTFYAYSGGLGGTFVTLEAQVLTGSVQVVGVPLNYPNPFKPLSGGSTMIQYNLTDDANVTLILFDITGQEVKRIVFTAGGSGGKAGINMVEWDGKSMFGEVVGNGMYIYKITSGGRTIGTGKLVVRD